MFFFQGYFQRFRRAQKINLVNAKKRSIKDAYSRQFDDHILNVTLLKSNLLLISSEQIMLLLKDFTAFFFNSCETIHVMNILGGGRSYLEPKGKELSQVFFVVVVVIQLKWS